MNTDIIASDEIKKEICSFLTQEITHARAELREIHESWDKWRRQRENTMDTKVKNWPWPKASNVSIPLSSTNTKTMFAAMKASFEQKKPFFTVKAHNKQHYREAAVLERYLSILCESKFHIDLRNVNNTIFYELVSLGIQAVHVPWLVDEYSFKRQTSPGVTEIVKVTKKDSPVIIPIMPENLFYRGHVDKIQRAEWIGIRNYVTKRELKAREQRGQYDDVDKIFEQATHTDEINIARQDMRIGITSMASDPYEIFEIYLYWDVDNDGFIEDVKVWFEPKSGTILRAEYNSLGVRPIACFKYIPYTNKELSGIGVGKMCDGLQDAATALFNMGINSTLISSLQMYITPEDTGLGPVEDFYPMKQIPMPNPRDFIPITFPNTLLPNLQMIQFIQQLVDRDTGATNAMSGFPDTYAKTRATASGTMFLAQQGSKMFNAITEGVEETFATVGSFIFFQLALNHERVTCTELTPEEQGILKNLLAIPPEQLPSRFSFSITTSEADQTEEAKKQKLLTMTQLYTQYGQQIMQMLHGYLGIMTQYQMPQQQMMALQKIDEYTKAFINGATKLMQDVFDKFGEDSDELLPNIQDIRLMVEMLNIQREGQYGQISQRLTGQLQQPGNNSYGGRDSARFVGRSPDAQGPPAQE